MAEDLNSVALVGRLTKNPELRVTKSGINVVGFILAVTRSFPDANGDYQADFISCVAWRKNAEYLSKYGQKGQVCSLHGSIQTRNYQDKDGKRVYVTEVQVDRLGLGKPNKSNGKQNSYQSQDTAPQDPFAGNTGDSVDISDDQLPF